MEKKVFFVAVIVAIIAVLFAGFKNYKNESLKQLPDTGNILKAGMPAPAFKLQTFDGETVSLDSMDSKLVFINFWATWCEPCREELPALEKLKHQFKPEQLGIITINMDINIELAMRFMDEYDLTLLTVHDKWHNIAKAYQYTGLPTSFLLNQERVIIKQYEGYKKGQEIQYVEDIKHNIETLAN